MADGQNNWASEPLKRRKLYQEVMDRLIAAISSAEYPPGSQLPSERDLMARFEVGRPAIREAMLTLQQMGLVRISHGERARVVNPTASLIIDQISSAMVMMLATNRRGLEDLKEARIMLETGLARMATSRATAAGIEKLGGILKTLHAAKGNSVAFVAADVAFHVQIAEMSGNQLIAATLRGMLEWLSRFKLELISVRGAERVTLDEHEKIFRAISSGDDSAAAAAMSEHLRRANKLYLLAEDAEAAKSE
jgi:DNA-binding FadR family transcriptional regulator